MHGFEAWFWRVQNQKWWKNMKKVSLDKFWLFYRTSIILNRYILKYFRKICILRGVIKMHKNFILILSLIRKSLMFEHFIKDFLHILVKSWKSRASLRGRISTPRWSWMINEHTGSIYYLWKSVFWALEVRTRNLEPLKWSMKLTKFGKIRSAPP